jgi:hypothetical protein
MALNVQRKRALGGGTNLVKRKGPGKLSAPTEKETHRRSETGWKTGCGAGEFDFARSVSQTVSVVC